MNDLKDFDLFSDYSYTYCARHLEEDGWSKQEWKQATDSYKKKLKALDIINKKEVDIHNFKFWIISEEWDYDDYFSEENDSNTTGHQFAYGILTHEEFNLLKEVLK